MARAARQEVALLALLALGAGCASDFERGVEAARRGRDAQARHHFSRAIDAKDEHSTEALVRRAYSEIELGDLEAGRSDILAARAAGASVEDVSAHLTHRYRHRIAWLATTGRVASAVACATDALRFEPGDHDIALDRAALRAALGERRAALRDVDGVLAVRDRADAYVLRALLIEADDRFSAIASLESALHFAPRYLEAQVQRARLALEGGSIKEALEHVSVAVLEELGRHPHVGEELSGVSLEEGLWLSLAPDLAHDFRVRTLTRVRHDQFLATLVGARKVEEVARRLRTQRVDARNIEETWSKVPELTVPCGLPDVFVAAIASAHTVLRERIFVTSLAASAECQLDRRIEPAFLHARRALAVAPEEFREVLQAHRTLLREAAAAAVASDAEVLLRVDAWRADARARRAVELSPTAEHRALANRVADAVAVNQATYVKDVMVRRHGVGLVVLVQLGAESGAMVSAPGRLWLDVDGTGLAFDVVADDYELEEVRLGDEVFWERTWRSPTIVRSANVREVRMRFQVQGGTTLTATKRLRE